MKSIKLVLISALLLITAACGGGGGGTPPTPSVITGVAAAGVIKGGTVKAFSAYSSVSGADKKQLGSTATTSNTGVYSIDLGTYTGPVIVEVTGGSYVDEATGATATIPAGAPLRAVAVSSTGTVNVAVTPLTELAAKQAFTLKGAGTLSAATVNQANAQISDLFKVDIIGTQPLDASAPLVGTQAQKDYTLALAALSQLANDPAQLGTILTALAGTISATGTMDSASVTSISTALSTFLASGNNNTGVSTVPETLQNLGTTTLTLTLSLAGTGVKDVTTDIVLPANVTVANSAGVVADGVLANLAGGTNVFLQGSVITAGTVRVVLLVGDAGFSMPAGDVLTVKTTVAAGVEPPAVSAFTLSNTSLRASGGVVVEGATLTLH